MPVIVCRFADRWCGPRSHHPPNLLKHTPVGTIDIMSGCILLLGSILDEKYDRAGLRDHHMQLKKCYDYFYHSLLQVDTENKARNDRTSISFMSLVM